MGKYKVQKEGETLWIKSVDNATGTITYTKNANEAYDRGADYYTKAEADFIKFHYKDTYPELETLVAVDLWCGGNYRPNP